MSTGIETRGPGDLPVPPPVAVPEVGAAAAARTAAAAAAVGDGGSADAAIADAVDLARNLHAALSAVLLGTPEAVTTAVVAALSGSHLLIEDVPGVGKTVLARALATAFMKPGSPSTRTPSMSRASSRRGPRGWGSARPAPRASAVRRASASVPTVTRPAPSSGRARDRIPAAFSSGPGSGRRNRKLAALRAACATVSRTCAAEIAGVSMTTTITASIDRSSRSFR